MDAETLIANIRAKLDDHLDHYGSEPAVISLDEQQRRMLWEHAIELAPWDTPVGLEPEGVVRIFGVNVFHAEHLQHVMAAFPVHHLEPGHRIDDLSIHHTGLLIAIHSKDVLYA